MTLVEKIVLLVAGSLIVLAVATRHLGLLVLCLWGLAGIYGVSGFWLWRRSPAPAAWVRVGAGGCLAAGLYALGQNLQLKREALAQLLPLLPGLLAAGVCLYLLRTRPLKGVSTSYRAILRVAASLWLFGAVAAYCPITVSGYRTVLGLVHKFDSPVADNLHMYDHAQRAEQALAAQNCAEARAAAHQAYAAGRRWLGADTLKARWKISGAYSTLYLAYVCQARAAFEQGRYQEALQNYHQAHHFLISGDHRASAHADPSLHWTEEQVWSLENMARCHRQLGHVTQSDSLFVLALNTYNRLHPTPNSETERLRRNLAQTPAPPTGASGNGSNVLVGSKK